MLPQYLLRLPPSRLAKAGRAVFRGRKGRQFGIESIRAQRVRCADGVGDWVFGGHELACGCLTQRSGSGRQLMGLRGIYEADIDGLSQDDGL